MKLYEVRRNTWVLLNGQRFYFEHIDGAYSVCQDEQGNPVHLAAWTEVEIDE